MKWDVIMILTGLFLFSCDVKRGDSIYYTEKERITNQILAQVAFKLRNEKGLVLCGTGGGMLDQVEILALSFDYCNSITIAEGRDLLLDSVQTFLSEINKNESIRPYLQNYPFETSNVEIRIFLQKAVPSHSEEENLCVISAVEGVFKYKIDATHGGLKVIYEETYQEALQNRGKPIL